MRKVYIPYLILTWCMLAVVAVNWLLQLVLFIHHDEYTNNTTLMVLQTAFVLYLAWQHVQFTLLTEDDSSNPHLLAGLLLILCALFILQAWWLLALMLLCMHSFFLGDF